MTLRRSLIFRWVLLYAALFSLLVGIVLAVVSWSAIAEREDDVDRQLDAEVARLRDELAGRTVAEIATVVRQTSRGPDGRTTIYLLATQRREYLAGDPRAFPGLGDEGGKEARTREFPLAPSGEGGDAQAGLARGRALTLPGGHRLLVARDVTALRELRELVTRSLLAVLGATVLLGVGGGLVLSRRLSERLAALARNSEAILEGDLRRRMPVSPRGDEFDALATSLNRMLDRIESLMNGMREVSDSIAHDMRSPISRLRSRIEVALLQPGDAQQYRHVLEQTISDLDGVLAMFQSLLTIALAESGAPRERFAPLDLRAIAAEGVETYEPVAEERGIRLTLDAPASVPLRGERNLLAQALANLLENAVKYVPAGGNVVVRVRDDADGPLLEVRDDGPGIPREFHARAFERFSRVEASRTTPGSGLGLSLVRAVAHLHGGEVTLADLEPGLAVGIRLPRA